MSDTLEQSSWVIEATALNFQEQVLDRSRTTPVVVDFWAAWCGPCRLLGPVLEKLAHEYGGKFVLAKVDTDRDGALAAEFGVRGIPAVFGVRDGKIYDAFVGVQSEPAIRHFVENLLPTPAESFAAEAGRLEQTDPEAALAKYNQALALAPNLEAAHIGLARVNLEQGRFEEAKAHIESLERRGFLEPEAEKVKAELTVRQTASETGGVEAARAALAANPDDLNLKFQLAEALAGAGQYADALALSLSLVERDRKGVGEKARQLMLAIFQLLPGDSELTAEYQRQLSFALME